MKVQYSYLKNFLPTDLSISKIANVFTKVGFECEVDGAIIDFDITPNRGDALSLRGLQREFHAYQSKKLKDKLSYAKLKFIKDKTVINKIDKSGCGNYHLMVINGISSLKSLDHQKRNFLSTAGVPLIHPLVDLGNYVMLEIGAPMHIFDLDCLELPINVVFQANNKPFQVIGGDYKNLQASSLTIQDQNGIQAVAGIIGGEKTSVSKKTKNIAVEAAFFNPNKIVNQARKYGLATDASHRFERGVDPKLQQKALARFLFLLHDIATYDSLECFEGDVQSLKTQYIPLSIERFNNFSGLTLTSKKIQALLGNLGFDLQSSSKLNLVFKVPSHRFDIELEEDLYEEILRCYGYDNIPINSPKSGPITTDRDSSAATKLRSALVFRGFQELMHLPFVSEDTFAKLNSNSRKPAELLNPINENEPMMRGSLFPSLFSAVNLNVKKGYSTIKIFELGNVFHKTGNAFKQESHLAGIIYNHGQEHNWGTKALAYDFYSLKAEVLQILGTLGIKDVQLKPQSTSAAFNLNSMDIFTGKKKIGVFGEIDIAITQKLVKNSMLGFELYPEEISNQPSKVKLRPSSKFPSSMRDMNIIFSKSHQYSEIKNVLSNRKIKYMSSFELVNTFEGREIGDGFISMTLRFTFQSNVKSLQESEINHSMDYVFTLLSKALKAKIRS